MPNVVDLHAAPDSRDVVYQAVELLTSGRLVVFPAENEYAVTALCLQEGAVGLLRQLLPGSELCLTLGHPEEVLDYLPAADETVWRLVKRAWPGPLEIQVPSEECGGLLDAWPDRVRSAVTAGGWTAIRCPAEPVLHDVLRLMTAPLLLGTVRAGGGRDANGSGSGSTAGRTDRPAELREIVDMLGDQVSLYVDAGPCQPEQAPSAVAVSGGQWKSVRNGIFSPGMVARMASRVVIFVCTGNTCRSPMAEALFRKFLTERLQCSEDELPARGFVVMSAGLSAADGMPASPEAVALLGREGIDLGSHTSRAMTPEMLDQADHIYTMTAAHREMILSARPELADRIELLSRDSQDISDPFAGSADDYALCRREIEKHLLQLLERWSPPGQTGQTF